MHMLSLLLLVMKSGRRRPPLPGSFRACGKRRFIPPISGFNDPAHRRRREIPERIGGVFARAATRGAGER